MSHSAGVPTAAIPRRRTQAERREATRQALIDAAVACLLEDGYRGLATRRVALRAGVSQPTQRVYFSTRAQFVAAAIERLAIELTNQARDYAISQGGNDRHRIEALLDQFWELSHGGPFQTMMELYGAARHDADVRNSVAIANQAVTRIIGQAVAEVFPELIDQPGFREFFETALATVRGLAMLAPLDPPNLARRWRASRRQLLVIYDALTNTGG